MSYLRSLFFTIVSIVLGNLAFADVPCPSEWTVTPKYQKDGEGVVVVPEARHPIAFRVFREDSELRVEITDNDHNKSVWNAVVLDGGRELLVFRIEATEGSGPDLVLIHRARFNGNECSGVTGGRFPIVEWTGVRVTSS